MQDDWKSGKQLTFNLGFRYDAIPHNYERYNQLANFVPGDFVASAAQAPGAGGTLNPNGPGFDTPAGTTTPFYHNGMRIAGSAGFLRWLTVIYSGESKRMYRRRDLRTG